jgi:hypothetical protein
MHFYLYPSNFQLLRLSAGYEARLGCLTVAVIVGVVAVSCHIRRRAYKFKPSRDNGNFTNYFVSIYTYSST